MHFLLPFLNSSITKFTHYHKRKKPLIKMLLGISNFFKTILNLIWGYRFKKIRKI